MDRQLCLISERGSEILRGGLVEGGVGNVTLY
jgi:hypothetical protein